jgi:hypothetical protein
MDCEWTLDEGCLGDEWETAEPAVKLRATSLAVDTLRRLTAYRVGGCPITVRPEQESRCCYFIPDMLEPWMRPGVNEHGQWINCSNQRVSSRNEVALPPPVGRIDEVKVDGVVVPSTDYRVDDGRLLVWQGTGDAPWPQTQDVTLADTEPGTFSVTYLNAHEVDGGGQYAAAILANEYAKACGGRKCRLPSGVTSIVRQGITMEIASGAFPGGLTGIREVDAWIALWNPDHLSRGATVWSPDANRMRVTGS